VFAEDEGDKETNAAGDALADALALDEAVGLADALADADGLALGVVTVIVVTPFWTVAVTRAPVVPMRNTPAIAPLFAFRSSSRSFSNMGGRRLLSHHRTSEAPALLGPTAC
jgi:hypothetical protein